MAAIPTWDWGGDWGVEYPWLEGAITLGIALLLLLPVGVLWIVDRIKTWVSRPAPPAPTCPDCGHPSFYHGRPTCCGKVNGSVGFAFEDPQQRCPCTLTRKDVEELERTACPDCVHPASFHSGPQCRGAAEHLTGFDRGQPGQTRCPCTLSETDLKGLNRGKPPEP